MYKRYIDPAYTYTNFTLDEQAAILKAGRSNNTLDHTKLCSALSGRFFVLITLLLTMSSTLFLLLQTYLFKHALIYPISYSRTKLCSALAGRSFVLITLLLTMSSTLLLLQTYLFKHTLTYPLPYHHIKLCSALSGRSFVLQLLLVTVSSTLLLLQTYLFKHTLTYPLPHYHITMNVLLRCSYWWNSCGDGKIVCTNEKKFGSRWYYPQQLAQTRTQIDNLMIDLFSTIKNQARPGLWSKQPTNWITENVSMLSSCSRLHPSIMSYLIILMI